MNEHGRLLLLKEKLLSLVEGDVDLKTRCMFQLKDFLYAKTVSQVSTDDLNLSTAAIFDAIDRKTDDFTFPKSKLLAEGGAEIDDELNDIL